MNEAKVKVAVIGAGRWGLQHTRILTERTDVELCAVVARTPERAAARAAFFGVRPYTDILMMLDRERPDLVTICLPNQEHFQPTLQVIQAGYPVLVEKPLVFDLDEAATLINEAAKRRLFFAINFNHRYAVPVELAHQAISQGRLGDPVFALWRFGGEGTSSHPYANVIETQCHGFDLLEYLCGPIDSIMAVMTDKTGKGYSSLVLALHFANGAVGSLVGTYDSSYSYRNTHLLEVNGTRGRVLVEDTVKRFSFQQSGSEFEEVWQAGYFNDQDREFHRTFDRHMDAIITAFKHDQDPPIHARAGRRACVLAHAAILSFEQGIQVPVESG